MPAIWVGVMPNVTLTEVLSGSTGLGSSDRLILTSWLHRRARWAPPSTRLRRRHREASRYRIDVTVAIIAAAVHEQVPGVAIRVEAIYLVSAFVWPRVLNLKKHVVVTIKR